MPAAKQAANLFENEDDDEYENEYDDEKTPNIILPLASTNFLQSERDRHSFLGANHCSQRRIE